MNHLAADFLTRCFTPDETIALLLRSESPNPPKQRIVALEKALAPRYLACLAHENRNGANVYAAANPLLSDRVPSHVTQQVSGSMARRWLRLCASGTDAQAACHSFRWRSPLHRLQPG